MKISLAAARVNAGLTQAEAGKLIGVSEDRISNYETGKSKLPLNVFKKMEKVYGITYEDINFF
nr:MAG TPA: Helix-turn-helix XRE-family like protein [Caudoviricetes sp.]